MAVKAIEKEHIIAKVEGPSDWVSSLIFVKKAKRQSMLGTSRGSEI